MNSNKMSEWFEAEQARLQAEEQAAEQQRAQRAEAVAEINALRERRQAGSVLGRRAEAQRIAAEAANDRERINGLTVDQLRELRRIDHAPNAEAIAAVSAARNQHAAEHHAAMEASGPYSSWWRAGVAESARRDAERKKRLDQKNAMRLGRIKPDAAA
ncbi:hypothetical protein FOS14_00785 [Skermania sp. ID1734]|uniref:hypothetical protein n=1 Tax=Skermania sp. ID1734 TaxID=2597516 RepID=UPI00117DB19D|nr:hypothetical protein [Skermania sp. ID1734]TSE01962.1 hypothetical protein FOS14_00785 [Skermania sp. ID1734]